MGQELTKELFADGLDFTPPNEAKDLLWAWIEQYGIDVSNRVNASLIKNNEELQQMLIFYEDCIILKNINIKNLLDDSIIKNNINIKELSNVHK